MIQPNRIHINNLPFEFAAASELHITRGWQPFVWKILVTDPAKWRALKNPVSIRIVTSGASGERRMLKLERWYIIAIEAHSSQMWEVHIADLRWDLLNRSFQGGWNIETADGETRGERKTSATRARVSCYSAGVEALQLLGENGVIDDRSAQLPTITLPANLGDSDGGGFVAGTLRDVDLFLEFGRMDMLPSRDGKLIITDRFEDKTKGILGPPSYAGFVAKRDIHWTKPRFITTTFEQRIERPFEVTLGAQATAAPIPDTDLAVVNVAPDFDINSVPKLREDGSEIVNWLSIDRDPVTGGSFLLTRLHQDYATFLARFMKPTGIPDSAGAMDIVFLERRYEKVARGCLFTTWKVDLSKTGVGRVYQQVRLGRLGPKGINLPAGHVFCDWSEYVQLALDTGAVGAAPVQKTYSQKHRYDAAVPAPFDTNWISDGQYALVFRLAPALVPNGVTRLQPGLIDPDIQYGDPADVANGVPNKTGDQVMILNSFKMRVFWNGLLASRVGKTERLFSIRTPAFAGGEVEEISIHVKNVTANWGHADTAVFPGVLLNDSELKSRARVVSQQIAETFKDAQSGVIVASGIGHLERNWPGGNIYEAVIEIGMEKEWSINTRFVVLPEVRGPITSSDKDLDGLPPGVIG
jgi:hypothetical protein